MPYITSIERMAKEEGRVEGREEGRSQCIAIAVEGVALALEVKYGAAGLSLLPLLEGSQDLEKLREVQDGIRRGRTLAEVREIIEGSKN